MLALGIDVGLRKGLDVVAMGDGPSLEATWRRANLGDLREIIRAWAPDVVAIDSPPSWATGGRSRRTEREIRKLGIQSYATPTEERGRGHRFYEWMEVGFEVFRSAGQWDYQRYRSGAPGHRALEVFPHATAVVLAGRIPPPGARRGRGKRDWRAAVLAAHGVPADTLRTMDQVDAALAALTGILALAGSFCAPGDPEEGVIVLPVRSLPWRRFETRGGL